MFPTRITKSFLWVGGVGGLYPISPVLKTEETTYRNSPPARRHRALLPTLPGRRNRVSCNLFVDPDESPQSRVAPPVFDWCAALASPQRRYCTRTLLRADRLVPRPSLLTSSSAVLGHAASTSRLPAVCDDGTCLPLRPCPHTAPAGYARKAKPTAEEVASTNR